MALISFRKKKKTGTLLDPTRTRLDPNDMNREILIRYELYILLVVFNSYPMVRNRILVQYGVGYKIN